MSWEPNPHSVVYEAKKTPSEADVKREFKSSEKTEKVKSTSYESSNISANTSSLSTIKKDLVRSLVIASFILGSELVLYLVL